MKIISRIVAVLIFIVCFGFALINKDDVTLRFFFGYETKGPLVLVLLVFFVSGAVLGVLAMTPALFRHRREVSRQKKQIAALQKEAEAQHLARAYPPQPDSVMNP
jgi:uncharacterized integral membrane protein